MAKQPESVDPEAAEEEEDECCFNADLMDILQRGEYRALG